MPDSSTAWKLAAVVPVQPAYTWLRVIVMGKFVSFRPVVGHCAGGRAALHEIIVISVRTVERYDDRNCAVRACLILARGDVRALGAGKYRVAGHYADGVRTAACRETRTRIRAVRRLRHIGLRARKRTVRAVGIEAGVGIPTFEVTGAWFSSV